MHLLTPLALAIRPRFYLVVKMYDLIVDQAIDRAEFNSKTRYLLLQIFYMKDDNKSLKVL